MSMRLPIEVVLLVKVIKHGVDVHRLQQLLPPGLLHIAIEIIVMMINNNSSSSGKGSSDDGAYLSVYY